ncbi:MAG TPA: hypothetical protein VHE30_23490 [Polyangiaceae bacterium]|nr:hypothetical protein [Polyangiaceae bacterium]
MPPKPARYDAASVRLGFVRGGEHPRGVAWYGARSFWGHLRHLAASAIATEDIDSRDWMTPDDPQELVLRIAAELGSTRGARTLTEALGRDVWVDYLADTGDDVSVSRAVARLVFSDYELPDPARPDATLQAPRGDILLFGGDTAYPVATADEIRSRVIVPFNQVLAEVPRDRPRVLLGIPGNHDWYDGLDGFGRMFRRQFGSGRSPQVTLTDQRRTRIDQYADFARQFVLGGHVKKPSTLELLGYAPVQNASYFALPVAPAIGLLGVDRQLKEVDARQRHFFQAWLSHHLGLSPWVLLPDPVHPFGEPSPSGTGMLGALGLTLTARPHFVLSGDIHHYRRETEGPTLHVTAGGGGAFLHPAPIRRTGRPADVEFPTAPQSRALLPSAPVRIMLGRAGFLPHFALGAVLAPAAELAAAHPPAMSDWVALGGTGLVIGFAYALLGGLRRGRLAVLGLAILGAMATAPLPIVSGHLMRILGRELHAHVPFWALGALGVVLASFGAAFVFGAFLAALTALGLERTQAFTALDHPGFKHFVRLRVRADGTGIDGWCLGLVDPLAKDEQPVVVDTFSWNARR